MPCSQPWAASPAPRTPRVDHFGVYGGFLDKIPRGSAINHGLTCRMVQTPARHYLPELLRRIVDGEIDPSFIITHTVPLERGPEMYKTFRDRETAASRW